MPTTQSSRGDGRRIVQRDDFPASSTASNSTPTNDERQLKWQDKTTDHSEVKQAMTTTVQLVSQALLLAATASATLGGDPAWTRKSSVTGDIPVPNEGKQQTCCVVADLDGDGIEDFVVGERTKTPSIVWYKCMDQRWMKHIIDNTPVKPEAGGVCFDVDADGDPDVVFGQDGSGADMWWWENPKPNFSKPWKRRLIKQGGSRKHHDQTVGDYDGDGKIELVSWNQGAKQLLLFEVPEEPRQAKLWSSFPVFRWESGRELEGFPSQPVDVDLDGQIDIVGGGRWFKHQGGTKYEAHVIDDKMRFTQCAAGQLVEGGRPEIVFSPGDMDGNAKWFEWNGGTWKSHDLGFVVHGHTCEVRDINADGKMDIFVGEMGSPGAGDRAKTYIWYGDGKGQVRKTIASHGQGIHEGLLSDLDGDDDLDILMKPYNHKSPRLDILLNSTK
jgi:hypothetical protein